MLTFGSRGLSGVLGKTRIHCRWASSSGGLRTGANYTLIPAKDPIYGTIVVVVPAGGASGSSAVASKIAVAGKVTVASKIAIKWTRPTGAQDPVCVICSKPIPGMNTLQAISGLASLVQALPPGGASVRFS